MGERLNRFDFNRIGNVSAERSDALGKVVVDWPMTPRPYKIGMYGGKFLPPHLGHGHCIHTMAGLCEEGHVIIFYGGEQERNSPKGPWSDVDDKYNGIMEFIEHNGYDNISVHKIDVSNCVTADGKEDWNMETPLVRKILPQIDVVIAGEPQYGPYFNRAYPEATFCLVDPFRIGCPISATMIRENIGELKEWII